MENNLILGLSSNTRITGLVILNGLSLIDYRVRLNKEKWSETKPQKILSSLHSCIKDYSIQYAVLSRPYEHHHTKEMETLFQAIVSYFKEKNVPTRICAIPKVLSEWKHKTKKKKTALKEMVVHSFPELGHLYEKDMMQSSVYYSKLFEAAGVAVFHQKELSVV